MLGGSILTLFCLFTLCRLWIHLPPKKTPFLEAGLKKLLPYQSRNMPDSRHGDYLGVTNYITLIYSPTFQLRNCGRGKQ